jgi:peptidoglycan/xylan/chitin deacetylase (PgdA/CDA1 family)
LTYIGTTSEKLRKQLDLLHEFGYETIVFKDIEEGNIPKKPIILTFDDSYDDFYTKAYPELLKKKMKAITYVITDKLDTEGYLTTNQLREMRNNGIEIASHTLTHPDLKTLTDEELRKEIFDSKAFLEKLLNEKVLSFAYPFGKYNLRIRKVVEDAGYKYATTVNPGNATFKEPLDLQRYKVYSDTDINNYLSRP